MPGGVGACVGDHSLLMHGSVGVSGAGGNGMRGTLTGGDPGVEVGVWGGMLTRGGVGAGVAGDGGNGMRGTLMGVGVCVPLIVRLGVVLLVVLFGMLVLVVWLLVLIVWLLVLVVWLLVLVV